MPPSTSPDQHNKVGLLRVRFSQSGESKQDKLHLGPHQPRQPGPRKTDLAHGLELWQLRCISRLWADVRL